MALNDFQMQLISLAVAFLLGIGIIAFRQRSFLFKFFRVAGSFGKLLMVKVRALPENYFMVGKIEDGFLIIKVRDITSGKLKKINITLPDKYKESIIPGKDGIPDRVIKTPTNPIYRALNLNWIDIDESLNCILMPDTSSEPGFDPHKWSDLLVRALYRPSLIEDKQKIIIILLVILLLFILGLGFFLFQIRGDVGALHGKIDAINGLLQGVAK